MIKLKDILNEARLNDIVPDIIFTAAQYTSKKLDHIAKQSWDSSDELMKQIMQNIPMSKWKPFRRDVDKLLKQHSIKEETLNEYQVDLSQMAVRLGEFSKILKGYQRRTTDPKWEKQLNSVIKDLNRLEDKFHNISRKLGIIPLK